MRTIPSLLLSLCLGLVLLSGRPGVATAAPPGRELLIGVLSQADDERYGPQALQAAWPDAPGGRALPAAQMALDDSAIGLRAAGLTGARLVPVEVTQAGELPAAVERLQRQGVRHIVLELPAAGVVAVAEATRGKDLLLVNAAAPEDALRGRSCAPHLLHTLPSEAMRMDALGQALVARKWARPLVLVGPSSADQLLQAAFERTAKRYGIKPVATKPFKLSNDPRERDLGNVRLLTAEREYDAVVVLDAVGEFAREVPLRTVLPRPVLGSAGGTARAWDALYERNGAPQLNRRFQRKAGRLMTSHDWAMWMAVRALVEAASLPQASPARQLQALRSGEIALDGYKGLRLSFRRWDGQLRQPLLLSHGNGVADTAPVDGFLHPLNTLDTLGFDEPESPCKAP